MWTRWKNRMIDLGSKAAERAAVHAVAFVYVQLAATDIDRATFREMKALLGRRLSVAEKQTVIVMRFATEATDLEIEKTAVRLGISHEQARRVWRSVESGRLAHVAMKHAVDAAHRVEKVRGSKAPS